MTAEITVVDLCLSQEDEERAARKEKRKEVVVVMEESESKRARLSDSPSRISQNDFKRLNERLNLVENIVTRDNKNQVMLQPTKKEFEDLVVRVSQLEDRVGRIEQMLGSIQNAFLGFSFPKQLSGSENKESNEATLRYNGESCPPVTPLTEVYPSTSTALPEKSSSSTRVNAPVLQGQLLGCSDNAKQSNKNEKKEKRRASVTNAPTIRHTSHSAVTITPLVTPIMSPVVTPVITPVAPRSSAVIIASSGNSRPMAPHKLRLSMDSPRKESQLVPATNNNQQHASTLRIDAVSKESVVNHPSTFEEVPDNLLCNIRIKQELFDDHHNAVRKDETSLMRRNAGNRIVVYVDGDARKIRNKDEYAAVLGWNAIPRKSNITYYLSEKKRNDVKKQAEIIASYSAIEHIKRNCKETGPLKITIVTNYSKLANVMKNIPHVYYNYYQKDSCTCEGSRCEHKERWSTMDQFARMFHDDLPQLVQSTRNIDVIWRTYLPDEEEERIYLRAELKQTLKASRNSM